MNLDDGLRIRKSNISLSLTSCNMWTVMEGLEKYYRITLVTDSVMAASHSTVVLVPFSISEAIYDVIMYT